MNSLQISLIINTQPTFVYSSCGVKMLGLDGVVITGGLHCFSIRTVGREALCFAWIHWLRTSLRMLGVVQRVRDRVRDSKRASHCALLLPVSIEYARQVSPCVYCTECVAQSYLCSPCVQHVQFVRTTCAIHVNSVLCCVFYELS